MPGRFPFPIPNGWFQVAWSSDLDRGALTPLEYFGRKLLLFRDEAGAARVMDRHCPHLGADLAYGGTVLDGRLRCPFHHWEFDGEGRCVAIPYAKHLPQGARLHSWPTVERAGQVLVYFDKEQREPAFEVPEIPEHGSEAWSHDYRREFQIASCNQELAENTVDPAHFRFVHGTAELPQAKAWTEGPLLRASMSYPIRAGENLVHGEIDIEAHGPGWGVTRFQGAIDMTVVAAGTPVDEETVHQRLSFFVRRRESDAATDALAKVLVGEIGRQFEEDMPMWENKAYWAQPVLCDGDGPIATVRSWAKQFY